MTTPVPPPTSISLTNSGFYQQLMADNPAMYQDIAYNTVNPFSNQSKAKEMILEAKEGFKFGCDPELFVFDPEGRPVPADMIPGTKECPYPVEHGAVQRDGFAAEFNTEPATTFKEFNRNIEAVMKQLTAFLPAGYTLQAVPSANFAPEIFDAAPDDAKELGCMPDFDAWTGEMNPPPRDPSNPYLRTASGHLHIGWTEDAELDDLQHIMNCRDLVKQFDWYLGGWSVKMDSDPTRRKLYGRAGACRFKPYGVEYRVLSNFWITSRDRRLAVWNRMQQAIDTMRTVYIPDRTAARSTQALIETINSCVMDTDLSQSFRYPLSTIDPQYCRI